MSLFFASLNSGSNGNCYYIGTSREAVLVDAGISCRETERRMARLGLDLHKVKAVFISHEHADHIKGLKVLSKKYRIPVYITEQTHRHSGLFLEETLMRSFTAFVPITIGGLTITGFSKLHDCADPHSFVISGHGFTVGVFTDLGAPCRHLAHYFAHCHAAFLEANYDEAMLENGSYPWYLKNRIRGGNGHLSNSQALSLFNTQRPSFMSHLLLSHLSKDNNSPELVLDLFAPHAGHTLVSVASRDRESAVYQLTTPEVVEEELVETVNGKFEVLN